MLRFLGITSTLDSNKATHKMKAALLIIAFGTVALADHNGQYRHHPISSAYAPAATYGSYSAPSYVRPSYNPTAFSNVAKSYNTAPIEVQPVHVSQPFYKPAPIHNHHAYDNAPVSYNYGYGVNDHYAGLNFGQQESREGHVTRGSYHVQLPDGRLQTVNYYVDPHSGYVADVSYSGVANYDATPAYEPRPTYGA